VSVLAAVEEFDALLAQGRPVPLTPEVRVERDGLEAAVARLRSAAAREDLVAQIEGLARRAKKVPLTGQVRLDPDPIRDLLGALRGG
jgi:hypothetical protein